MKAFHRWIDGVAVSVLFLAFIVLSHFSFSRSDFFEEHIENFSEGQILFVAGIFTVLMVAYAMLFLGRRRTVPKTVWFLAIATALFAAISPPFLSRDIGAYLIGAKHFALFHVNPYDLNLNAGGADAWLSALGPIWWLNHPYIYGPVFLIISSLAVLPNVSHLIAAVYLYKLLVVAAYALSIYVFRNIVRTLGKDERLVLLLAANPALLINGLVDGHNELFIILFLLLALYCLTAHSWVRGYASLMSSVLIKYNTFMLLPLFWKRDGKFSSKRIIMSLLMALGISAVVLFLLGQSPQEYATTFSHMNDRCLYQCSPFTKIADVVFGERSNIARGVIFLALYAFAFFKYIFKNNDPLRFVFWSFFWLIFLVARWVTPWYPLVIIPVALLLDTPFYKGLALCLTIYSLFHFFLL